MATLYIKNMVCNRCIAAVNSLMIDLGYVHFQMGMGWVTLKEEELQPVQKQALMESLEPLGFETARAASSQRSKTSSFKGYSMKT